MLYSANYDLCMSMYLVDRANKKPHNELKNIGIQNMIISILSVIL